MTLLNTPMPAEKALKTIRSMFESNPSANISIIYTDNATRPSEETIANIKAMDMEMFFEQYHLPEWEATITWINQIIPTYSVWDKVLILSTGEIGNVTKIRWDHRDKPIELNNDTDMFYHRSEICKLPNDL